MINDHGQANKQGGGQAGEWSVGRPYAYSYSHANHANEYQNKTKIKQINWIVCAFSVAIVAVIIIHKAYIPKVTNVTGEMINKLIQ